MTHSYLLQDGQTVFVGTLAKNLRSKRPQLRIDGPNGHHKIMWLSKGNARVMINAATKIIGPNTFVFIPNRTPHTIDMGQNINGTFITIAPETPIKLPEKPFVFHILNIMQQAEIAKLIDNIVIEASSDNDGRFMAMEAYTSLLMVHILRLTGDKIEMQNENSAQKLMRRFAQVLEIHYRSGRSLNEYANVLGVTPTHLSRVSRKLNNKSASQVIQDRVLNEASQMLLHSTYKVQDISRQLGFSSPAYFTRLFSAKMRQTPKDFRKSRTHRSEDTQHIMTKGI